MYRFLWNAIPAGTGARVAVFAAVAVLVVVTLFAAVFPAVERMWQSGAVGAWL